MHMQMEATSNGCVLVKVKKLVVTRGAPHTMRGLGKLAFKFMCKFGYVEPLKYALDLYVH